jgi:hypothetical protein
MRISVLLKREPFGQILENTLVRYFENRYGRSHSIKWFASRPAKTVSPNTQIWWCNPYLNSIFLSKVSKQVIKPILLEYSRSQVWWRRPFQYLYVHLALHRPFNEMLCSGGITLSSGLHNARNLLILGGNHHLRILDWASKTCAVILKNGENPDFMKNEVSIRVANSFLPCPQITEIADDSSWYVEQLIFGTPVNRLKNVVESENAVNKIIPDLMKLYEKSLEIVDMDWYAKSIRDRILSRIPAISRLNNVIADDVLNIAKALLRLIGRRPMAKIPVVQCHGDFHPANILKDGERAWLIDWEYSCQRQLAYDSLVYGLSSRFPEGLSQRISQTVRTEKNSDPFDFKPFSDGISKYACNYTEKMGLFLLEELDLLVMENSNPLLFRLSPVLSSFMLEAVNAVAVLQ